MTDTARAFDEGDSVISTRCLVSMPTEPGGIRIEIPLASRGVVSSLWPGDDPQIYTVAFEVGEGGIVEIVVTEAQIARVRPPELPGLPPLVVKEPDRKIRSSKTYVPTMAHPHVRCRLMHHLHVYLMFVVYGIVLSANPVSVPVITLIIVLSVYAHEYRENGRLRLMPTVLQVPEPDEDERIEVSHRHLGRVMVTDVLFALSVAGLLVCHISNKINPSAQTAALYVILCVAALVAWVAKTAMHSRAVRIVPHCNA